MAYKLLIINPGSTSTKLAIYEDEKKIVQEDLVVTQNEPEPEKKNEEKGDRELHQKGVFSGLLFYTQIFLYTERKSEI